MIARWILTSLIILSLPYLLPQVDVTNFWYALLVAVVLGFVNAVIRPLLIILTLPVTILTLGLFLIVINALMIMLVSRVLPGFHVDGFWAAVLVSVILWIGGTAINSIVGPKRRP
ncbi:MAG: phage holin family protein [Candidatus Kerfeldbacteria bacterium]|nr:phage holin family protein [Candidatus Kerfeldbacteria bacterium]